MWWSSCELKRGDGDIKRVPGEQADLAARTSADIDARNGEKELAKVFRHVRRKRFGNDARFGEARTCE